MSKKALLAASLAGVLAFGASAAQIYVNIAPPAPRHEIVPAARAGHVWVPGHYVAHNNHRFAWVAGHWVRERPGYAFNNYHWVQRGNGTWYLAGGNWERRVARRDRDHDGIANRYDRDRDGDGIRNNRDPHPNRVDVARTGPRGDMDRDGIRNRNDRDKDGDGVRNSRDNHPNDRSRS
jgi:hypothetical protein